MPSELKIRRRVPIWDVCPPLGTDINWGHSLTKGLKICLVGNNAYGIHHIMDLADAMGNGGMRFTLSGGAAYQQYFKPRSARVFDWFANSDTYKYLENKNKSMPWSTAPAGFLYAPLLYIAAVDQLPNWDLSKGFSVYIQGLLSGGLPTRYWCKGRTDNGTVSFSCKGSGSDAIFLISDNGTEAGGNVKSITAVGVAPNAALTCKILSTFDGSDMRIYSYGNLAAEDTFSGTIYQSATSRWGETSNGIYSIGPNDLTYLAVWDRALTPGEALDTTAFSQIFRVSRKQTFEIKLPASDGGGGPPGGVGSGDDDDPLKNKDITCQDVL